MAEAIHIRGLADLERAFKLADREEAKLLRREVRAAAEPVRNLAEGRAVAEIRRMTPPWARMRIGQKRSLVYIVPKQKGSRGRGPSRRPNLKTLLLDRAMIPALETRREATVARLETMLGTVGGKWERA